MEKIKKLGITPLWILLFITPFLWGGFYDFSICFINIFLIIILLVKYIKSKCIKIEFNYIFFISIIFIIGNFITLFYGIDKVDCLFGILRSLTLFMFVVNLNQIEEENRKKLFYTIPISGIVMMILSTILAIIPSTRNIVVTDGNRLTGLFQYANTYAIFLLIGLNLFFILKVPNKIKIPICILFIISILFTGSRITFFLLILNFFIYVFKMENKNRPKFIIGFIFIIFVSLLFAILTNNFQNVGRVLTSSFSSSTLIGRLIYYKDGLFMLLNNAFGYGYMGYSYIYPKFQTAPYYIKFIHNDYLQIALDIGIIPLILFLGIIIKSFFNKNISNSNKLILLLLAIHMFFEFDFQFISILFVFSLLIYNKSEKNIELQLSFMIIIFGLVLIIWSGYYSIANFSNIFGSGELGLNLIPDYTEVKEKNILKYYESNDLQSAVKLADEVLNKNKYSIISYNIKAYYDCNEKLYDDMIIQKKSAIALDKYNIQMYDDYILLLSRSIENSIKLNDYDNANKYIGYVLEVENILENLKENTDNLSYKLKDAPVFELSDSSKKYLDVLKENNK